MRSVPAIPSNGTFGSSHSSLLAGTVVAAAAAAGAAAAAAAVVAAAEAEKVVAVKAEVRARFDASASCQTDRHGIETRVLMLQRSRRRRLRWLQRSPRWWRPRWRRPRWWRPSVREGCSQRMRSARQGRPGWERRAHVHTSVKGIDGEHAVRKQLRHAPRGVVVLSHVLHVQPVARLARCIDCPR